MDIKNLNPKSALSYLMLKLEYESLDKDHIQENFIREEVKKGNIHYKIGLKKAFFKKVKNKFGTLKCQICGDTNLLEVSKTSKIPKNLATIEHFIPTSLGGFRYVDTNFICTCNGCNNKRGIKELIPVGDDMFKF